MAQQMIEVDHGKAPPATGRLLAVGVMAAVISAVVNDVLALRAVTVLRIPDAFPPLHTVAVTVVTVGGVAFAVSMFGLIARGSGRPLRLYVAIAGIALVHSWLPDLAIYLVPVFPGTTGTGVAGLDLALLSTQPKQSASTMAS